jgi:23S rRNA (cytosine1962-C5)-methyltransferase
MDAFAVTNWQDYELLDFGKGRKLERFGAYLLDRPETLANGPCSLPASQWESLAHARYDGPETGKGTWVFKRPMPDSWHINCPPTGSAIQLFCSPFKHIGIFPEQASNWNYIHSQVKAKSDTSILNLFAYTGAASIIASSAGARVTHVDSSKSIVTRARINMDINELGDIRWIVEDAVKFAEREVRRMSVYDGIILDPPAFGRGPKGEIWKLEDHLPNLLDYAVKLLSSTKGFIILNTYSPGLPPERTEQLLRERFCSAYTIQTQWLSLESTDGRNLPMSVVNRVFRT